MKYLKMNKALIISLVVNSIGLSILRAESTKPNIEYLFVKNYIECLRVRKSNDEKAKTEAATLDANSDESTTIMTGLHRKIISLQECISILSQYKTENNDRVAEIALVASNFHQLQMEITKRTITLLEDYYDNPSKFKKGKFNSQFGMLTAELENVERKLLDCAILLKYVLISNIPGKDQKTSYLTVNKNEREDLISDLDVIFGHEISDGLKGGQSYLVASGAVIATLLKKDFKSADER